MLNSITKAIISSAIIITPFLTTSQVQAADENNYDVSECVTIRGTATLDTLGALMNNSTSTELSVRCPIQRDRNHSSIDSASSFVLVRDHHNELNVECRLRQNIRRASVATGEPNIIALETLSATTNANFSSSEYQRLYFPTRNFTNTDDGSFYLLCVLPPRQIPNRASSISSYHIDED